MGDPRKPRKKYTTPTKPWTKERVVEENELIKSYGLKNKTEIYKADSKLKKFLALAKRFATIRTKQDETEKELFLKKMKELGFLEKGFDISVASVSNLIKLKSSEDSSSFFSVTAILFFVLLPSFDGLKMNESGLV